MSDAADTNDADKDLARDLANIADHVTAALLRVTTVRTSTAAPRARKRPTPLTAEDYAHVRDTCIAYALADSAHYDVRAWSRYLAHAAFTSNRIVVSTNAAPRQMALYRSLCSALAACAGHQAEQAALRTAYEHAFAAVAPLKQDPGDLVLDLDATLGDRRTDMPAGVRAQIASAYAHALDPVSYPPHAQDPARAKKDIETRRYRRRQAALVPKRHRDTGALIVL